MATQTAPAPTEQITLSDLHPDGLSEAQVRRIVALLGLAQPRRSDRQHADGPELDCRQLGA
jgi:hypothetical protein